MTDEMNIAYLALGRLIAGQCPAGFRTATLDMEIHESGTRLWLISTQQDGTEVRMPPADDAARDILESLRAIRKAMPNDEGALWRGCVVTLSQGGGFAIEPTY
jgi:hypothetical protein